MTAPTATKPVDAERPPARYGGVEAVVKALSAPFAPELVRWKPGALTPDKRRCLAMPYVTARAVQQRLDEVVGVANWQDDYEPLEGGAVLCRLSVRLGGEWICKADVGGESEQEDEGDRRKAAVSDALKRAAVKFGVGRYLYALPAQWVDYDPQRRSIVRPPQLPAWALPAAGPRPPRSAPTPSPDVEPAARNPKEEWVEKELAEVAKRAPAPAAALPESGAELAGRLLRFEDNLVGAGLCVPGELLAFVGGWGRERELPDDMAKWPVAAIPGAVEAARVFEGGRRSARKEK